MTTKQLIQPANGSTSWDVPLNKNFAWTEAALGAVVDIPDTSGTHVLTNTPTTTTPVETQYMALRSTASAFLANVVYQIPSGVAGQWVVINQSAASTYTLTISCVGTSVVVDRGTVRSVYCDGTNVMFADTPFTSVGADTQVIYNSGGALTGSSQLTFDNTTLSIGGSGAVSGASWTGGTATVTFSGTKLVPVNSIISVTGVAPTGYNGDFVVTASSAGSVSYAIASDPGSWVSGGTVAYGNLSLGGTKVTSSATELSYTSGVTGPIQTQLNNKFDTSSLSSTGRAADWSNNSSPVSPSSAHSGAILSMSSVATTSGTSVGFKSYTPTAITTVSNVATATGFGAVTFPVGSVILLTGVTPAAYNGIWTVTASSSGSVSFNIGTTPANATVFGQIGTGVPPGTKRITIMFNGVTTGGNVIVQLGTSSGLKTSGYISNSFTQGSNNTFTTGFGVYGSASSVNGSMVLTAMPTGDTWMEQHGATSSAGAGGTGGGGSVALSGTITQIAIIPSTGSFSAGSVAVMYE